MSYAYHTTVPRNDGFHSCRNSAAGRAIGGAIEWGKVTKNNAVLVDALAPPSELKCHARAPGEAEPLGLAGGEQLAFHSDGQTIRSRARGGRCPAGNGGDRGQQSRADGDVSGTVRQAIDELQRSWALG